MLPIDHLMMGVADFRASASRWESEHGLTAIEGITFDDSPAFANWAVPLGETWVELVGVTRGAAADSDARALMFSQMVSTGDRLMGWALVPADLDAVAQRLGLTVSPQHATHSATGEPFTWRQVGFEETRTQPYLPFFLGWDHDVHAEMALATVEVDNARVRQADVTLELTGDPQALERWLGDIEAPVTIAEGTPSITGRIPTDRGVLILR